MPGLVRKSLDAPEETRPFEGDTGELQLVNLFTGAIPLTMTGVTTDQFLLSSGSQVTTQLSMS